LPFSFESVQSKEVVQQQFHLCSAQYVALQKKIRSKDVGLAQQNGFGPTFLYIMERLGKCASKPNTC
jgi:hypothetical protein